MPIELPAPITKVLTALSRLEVRTLMMGGWASVVYGALEFSRDLDVAVYATPPNIERLRAALARLRAEVIAVPPFTVAALERGHAVHFRCGAAEGVRLDIMTTLRGVPGFDVCWARRSIVDVEGAGSVALLGIEDLVAAKKTRRDKDWPVVRRLVDVHYAQFSAEPTPSRVAFWLRELRTPESLVEIVQRAPEAAGRAAPTREAVARAIGVAEGRMAQEAIRLALRAEEDRERQEDEAYWAPLLDELREMRRARRADPPGPPPIV